ncbi:MAG TPA: hypothetical protein VGD09_05190 [Blastococcus sp.]
MGSHVAGTAGAPASGEPDATAVVLLHGWPDSVLRYQRVLPLLTDVHVVVPALPGYPFAAPLAEKNLSSADMATVVAGALAELGTSGTSSRVATSAAASPGRRPPTTEEPGPDACYDPRPNVTRREHERRSTGTTGRLSSGRCAQS